MSLGIVLLVALVISISATSARVEAKPISQNQVKFRRLPPKEFSASLGSSITIECEAGGSPPPTIHWLKDGKLIKQSETEDNQLDNESTAIGKFDDKAERIALSFTRSRLFIDCADVLDQAVYTCVAENIFSRISSHTKLNLIKPIAPPLTINGNELLNGSLEEMAAAGGELEAMGAEKSLSAVPQCLNEKGSRTTEPVRIYMWTHNMVEFMTNSLILFCRSNVKKSQRDKNISWTLPDEKQVDTEHRGKFEIQENGDLLIKNLVWADMGSYVCTVSDEQSSDSISTFVYPTCCLTRCHGNACKRETES